MKSNNNGNGNGKRELPRVPDHKRELREVEEQLAALNLERGFFFLNPDHKRELEKIGLN